MREVKLPFSILTPSQSRQSRAAVQFLRAFLYYITQL